MSKDKSKDEVLLELAIKKFEDMKSSNPEEPTGDNNKLGIPPNSDLHKIVDWKTDIEGVAIQYTSLSSNGVKSKYTRKAGDQPWLCESLEFLDGNKVNLK